MGYKLLMEIVRYEENKDSYTIDEQRAIEKSHKLSLNKLFKTVGTNFVDFIDKINSSE